MHGSSRHPSISSHFSSFGFTPSTFSKVVPGFPSRDRTKRDAILEVLWEPGRNDCELHQLDCFPKYMLDLLDTHSQRYILPKRSKPLPHSVDPYTRTSNHYVWALCCQHDFPQDGDSPIPPIRGCLQMIMLCNTLGLSCSPTSFARSRILSLSSVCLRKTGSRMARAWPILLIERSAGTTSFAGEVSVADEREEGSRK